MYTGVVRAFDAYVVGTVDMSWECLYRIVCRGTRISWRYVVERTYMSWGHMYMSWDHMYMSWGYVVGSNICRGEPMMSFLCRGERYVVGTAPTTYMSVPHDIGYVVGVCRGEIRVYRCCDFTNTYRCGLYACRCDLSDILGWKSS